MSSSRDNEFAVVNKKSRGWCFTWNNPDVSGSELAESIGEHPKINYLVFQLEAGDAGTPHFQGYLRFRETVRRAAVSSLLPRANLRAAMGTAAQNKTYCTKEEGRLEGPWEIGRAPAYPGERTDLLGAVSTIKESGLKRTIEQHPQTFARYPSGLRQLAQFMDKSRSVGAYQPKEVILCFGATRTGKSRYARSLAERTSDGELYIHSNTDWYDGYSGEELVVMDDFGSGHKIPLDRLLKITDCYDDFRVPVKGGFTRWYPKTIVFTSNSHPYYWYDWGDRKEEQRALAARFTQVRMFFPNLEVKDLHDPAEILDFFLNPGLWDVRQRD